MYFCKVGRGWVGLGCGVLTFGYICQIILMLVDGRWEGGFD